MNHIFGRFAPEHTWLLHYKFFGVLALLAFLLLLLRQRWFRSGLLYVGFYPGVITLWHVPRLLFRNWAIVIAFAPAIHRTITTFRGNFIWVSLLIFAMFAISVSNQAIVIISAMCMMGIYLVRWYWLDFRRVFRPTSVFSDLAGIVRKLGRGMDETVFVPTTRKLSAMDRKTQTYHKEYENHLLIAYIYNILLQNIAEKFKGVAASKKLDAYLICTILATLVLTVAIFSFEYWALYKLAPASFSANAHHTFLSFVGFSFWFIA